MANMPNLNITVKASTLPSEETFSGEICRICGESIYGLGFMVVMVINLNENPIPKFKELNVVLCISCKNALKW